MVAIKPFILSVFSPPDVLSIPIFPLIHQKVYIDSFPSVFTTLTLFTQLHYHFPAACVDKLISSSNIILSPGPLQRYILTSTLSYFYRTPSR